jgi:flagellar FliJ protein
LPPRQRPGPAHAMRSNETVLKLRRFEVNEKQQKVAEIEMMIADFRQLVEDLSHQIELEEETSRIRDVNHFSYPTFAKAARQRRDNLLSSIKDLEVRLESAKSDLNDALEELRKCELVEERCLIDHDRSGAKANGRDMAHSADRDHAFGDRA